MTRATAEADTRTDVNRIAADVRRQSLAGNDGHENATTQTDTDRMAAVCSSVGNSSLIAGKRRRRKEASDADIDCGSNRSVSGLGLGQSKSPAVVGRCEEDAERRRNRTGRDGFAATLG